MTILVDVEKARAKDVKVEIKPNKLKCLVHGKIIFDGQPFSTVIGTARSQSLTILTSYMCSMHREGVKWGDPPQQFSISLISDQ